MSNILFETVLQRMGLTARWAAKKPLLSQKMLEKRVEWCLAHRDWTAAD